MPFDPRRSDWSGTSPESDDVTFSVDETGDAVPPSTVVVPITAAQTGAAIAGAMATWDAVTCASIPLTANAAGGHDLGVYAYLVTGGARGGPEVVADLHHAGWRDVNFPGDVLGATITFVFLDADDQPTDLDQNRRVDVAFREVYYDPSWIWRVDGGDVDVESIAVHEAGHGLSHGHFGTPLVRHDGSFHASSLAVMNALYQGPLRTLLGTDNSSQCNDWENWPSR